MCDGQMTKPVLGRESSVAVPVGQRSPARMIAAFSAAANVIILVWYK